MRSLNCHQWQNSDSKILNLTVLLTWSIITRETNWPRSRKDFWNANGFMILLYATTQMAVNISIQLLLFLPYPGEMYLMLIMQQILNLLFQATHIAYWFVHNSAVVTLQASLISLHILIWGMNFSVSIKKNGMSR